MGSISGKTFLGRKTTGTTQQSSNRPYFTNTGYSSINGNTINFDPSIRSIQDNALQRYGDIYGDIGNYTNRFLGQSGSLRSRTANDIGGIRSRTAGAYEDLRSRYLGNQGSYINARVNPVKERFAALRGQVSQDLGRRGLGGSSLAFGSLRDVDTQAAREEADARALATNEGAQFESGLIGQSSQFDAALAGELANFEAGLNGQELAALNQQAQQRAQITGETLEVAKARLLQELNAFGLGSQSQGSSNTEERDRSHTSSGGYGFGGGGGTG